MESGMRNYMPRPRRRDWPDRARVPAPAASTSRMNRLAEEMRAFPRDRLRRWVIDGNRNRRQQDPAD